MAPEGAMAVIGGNWRIFHEMVKKSGAGLVLNSSVTAISLADGKTESRPRYTVRIDGSDDEYPVEFDDLVLANPFQFSKITPANGVIQNPIDEIPYVKLHVTIFASPFRYSPAFFGLTEDKEVPGTVLTTLGKDDEPSSGAGKAGFFSISTLRKVLNPTTGKEEHLYKIFSPEKVTAEFLRFVSCPAVLSPLTRSQQAFRSNSA